MRKRLVPEMPAQPDDSTCGPSFPHAVYRFHRDDTSLDQVTREVTHLETGGTLAVLLALHALRGGCRATTCAYSLSVFDPTWTTVTLPTIDVPRDDSDFARDVGSLPTRTVGLRGDEGACLENDGEFSALSRISRG